MDQEEVDPLPQEPVEVCLSKVDSTTSEKDFCLICHDISSGVQHGVPACDGCKAFFRRIVRKDQVMPAFVNCVNQGNCRIDRFNRTECGFCRLEACHRIGMKSEIVNRECYRKPMPMYVTRQKTNISRIASVTRAPKINSATKMIRKRTSISRHHGYAPRAPVVRRALTAETEVNEQSRGFIAQQQSQSDSNNAPLGVKNLFRRLTRSRNFEQKWKQQRTSNAKDTNSASESAKIVISGHSSIWIKPISIDLDDLKTFAEINFAVVYSEVKEAMKNPEVNLDTDSINCLAGALFYETIDSACIMPVVSSLSQIKKLHCLTRSWHLLYVLKRVECNECLSVDQGVQAALDGGWKRCPTSPDFMKALVESSSLLSITFSRLHSLKLSSIEVLILKLLVVFKPSSFAEENVKEIEKVDKLQTELLKYLKLCSVKPTHLEKEDRACRILSVFLDLRELCEADIVGVFFPNMDCHQLKGVIEICLNKPLEQSLSDTI